MFVQQAARAQPRAPKRRKLNGWVMIIIIWKVSNKIFVFLLISGVFCYFINFQCPYIHGKLKYVFFQNLHTFFKTCLGSQQLQTSQTNLFTVEHKTICVLKMLIIQFRGKGSIFHDHGLSLFYCGDQIWVISEKKRHFFKNPLGISNLVL